MQRRSFISGAAAGAGALAFGTESPAAQAAKPGMARDYYLLRQYSLTRAEAAGCDRFLETALLPALGRLGYRNTGVFGLEYGEQTPSTYLLLTHTDQAKLLRVEDELAADAEFVRAAAPFRSAPAAQPAFQRVQNTLLRAFEGHPSLTVPQQGKRILQLRTYESPSVAAYLRKVQMFHSGEFEIFAACGMPAVFYAHTLIGARMPALTYMLRFGSLAELEEGWNRFRANPEWRKLQADPRFSGEDAVSNITNLLLTPKPFSAI